MTRTLIAAILIVISGQARAETSNELFTFVGEGVEIYLVERDGMKAVLVPDALRSQIGPFITMADACSDKCTGSAIAGALTGGLQGATSGAEAGAAMGGPWGAAGGAVIGGTVGGIGGGMGAWEVCKLTTRCQERPGHKPAQDSGPTTR